MQIEKYTRKPFEIDAVRVTEENFKEVANWCQGEIREEGDRRFIKVRTHHPLSPRQTMAYVGDWVLYANNGYKVYTQKAFNKSFEKKDAPARGPVFQELAQRGDVRIEQANFVANEDKAMDEAVKTVQEIIPGSTVISEEQTPGEKFRGEG